MNDPLGVGMLEKMSISEAARRDLYNGLSDLLGPDRAETLMAYLPEFDPKDVAMKSDTSELKSDISELGSDLHGEIKALRGEMTVGFASVNERFDRLYLALIAGFFVIVAAMAGIFLTTL